MKDNIAIQGIKGSFHHIVAEEFFSEEIEVVECMSFDETVSKVLNEECEFAVMAIENSIVGSIIPNYALIDENNLHIVGEHYLDIQHNLLSLNGQSIKEINEVHSHPMALLQCKKFLKSHPHLRLVEDKDTAEVAKRIRDKKLLGIAAIASSKAAELYSLNVLAKSIQTKKENETRFVIVQKKNGSLKPEVINKASLKFDVEHKRGSLASVLNVISDCKLNLTKIQSLPKLNNIWKYDFFVDVTFQDYKDFEKAVSILRIMAGKFKILGEYINTRR